jgi:hypothetical protein
MKSYLKTKHIEVEGIDEALQIRELSTRAQVEIMELHRAGSATHTAGLICKLCVVEWGEESVESIEGAVPPNALGEIAKAVYELSGITLADVPQDDKKNSSIVLNVDSSLDSQH